MLKFIDSHAHYDDESFDKDRNELLHRIHNENGVQKIINIGCNIERSELSVKLANEYSFVYASVGIHPQDVDNTPADYLDRFAKLIKNEKVVAIGEIGLDYHYDEYSPEIQIRFFEEQLDFAEENGLPVIIHSRDATEDTMKILSKRGKINGVMHCFSGSAETAKQVLSLGMHISFTGVLTFKNARRAIEALEVTPIQRLLLETDCPYMAPEPNRGKRCDSSMISDIIMKIAEIKGVTPEFIANQTILNTSNLFFKNTQRLST